ncbi:MAG: hypothetical protein JWP97_3365, partial [Labilithrix sp.]|nr:hypothetical protein [Labilithrix sp.]
ARLLVVPVGPEAPRARVDGAPVTLTLHPPDAPPDAPRVWVAELPAAGAQVHVELDAGAAFWVVRRAEEIPPPPPQPWVPDPSSTPGAP